MEQKVIITSNAFEINDWIAKGWRVKSVVASSIAMVSRATAFSTPDVEHGKFCFVLER